MQRIEPGVIARRYYDPDEPRHLPHAASAEAMTRFLGTMLEDLVQLALRHGSAVLATHLKASIKQHGSAKLTAVTLRMVEQASRLAAATPSLDHGVGLWFRPLIARRLTGEGIDSLGALIDVCNARGGSWWRSIPRIGAHRARVIVAWLRRYEPDLGKRVEADVDTEPLVPVAGLGNVIVIGGPVEAPRLAPFERLAIPTALSGEHGTNRGRDFAFIRAEHDLAAVHAYLNRYRDRPPTLRAYTRELERLVLWLVIVRGVALSSMTVEDCEAYKDFLKAPIETFVGPKRSRASGRWRPFATNGLAPESQAYAVRTIRAAFAWLTSVRYLAGNPWHAVTDPVTVSREAQVQVERALPHELWATVRAELDARCAGEDLGGFKPKPDEARQWRIARAAILLMGDSGLRRDEATHARREDLGLAQIKPKRSTRKAGRVTSNDLNLKDGQARSEEGMVDAVPVAVWALMVIGKRQKERTVPVSGPAIAALRAHWQDGGRDFDAPDACGPLIVPIVINGTDASIAKHGDDLAEATHAPYSPDALAHLARSAIQRIASELLREGVLSHDAHAKLVQTSAHAFRHTFGTRAVAREMPIDVVQRILGHASLQTTSIYVHAERARMLDAAAQYYAGDQD
ncbi:phage integrase family protein [Caballeronia sp. 15715]|uniref:phage integrase family protein n=1 Tax=unclassified Caballeronia TaxID=2646786 RepID=UPI0039E33E07